MFENVLDQNVTTLIQEDIQKDSLPNSLLFSGPEGSGKLTCAIETARVLSCTNTQNRGNWNCTCSSCLKHKALIHPNLLIVGSRECVLEIDAAKKTFMTAIETNAQYLPSARYLFIRSIRKLTIRFSPLLWEEDDKLSKISPLIANIDELLEEIDPAKPVPESVGAPRMPSFSQIATREMVVAQLVNSVSPNFIVDKRAMELLMNRQTRISHDVDMTTMQDCITIRTADGGVVDIKGIQWSDGKIDVRSVDVRSPCSAELRRNEKGQLCRGKLFPWC